MSREHYRARSKKIQKLGRDGLVEQDKATGQEERISQRTADVSFGPERSPEQAAGRTASQGTPAQGRRHRRCQPSPSPEPDQLVARDAAEIGSSMRQSDDMPAAASFPAVADTRTRQAEGSDVNASVTSRLHGKPSAAKPASDPAMGLTHRQQKRFEKAERRVEQSGHRLEKTQEKLPARRRTRLEKEYDASTGKVRHRLRFEDEVLPESVRPSLPTQLGRAMKTEAVMKIHGKIRETERQNVAVEAAHKGEFAAERGAGRLLRWKKQRLQSKPYRAVRQAEGRLRTDQTRLIWQTAFRDSPELRRQSILSKWMQKQKIKRKYAQAVREAQKSAQHTRQAMTAAGKMIRTVRQYAAPHKGALLILAMLALMITLFSAGLASCTAMLSGVQSSYLSATYLSGEQEICNSELYFTELETDLRLDIAGTEANYPGYDEYRYSIGEISHNPYELMSYLSAAYGVFTFEQVRPELERLFGESYQLTRTPVTLTLYDENDEPYKWSVLQTTLTVKQLGDSISSSLTPGEQTNRYAAYMQTYGNRQVFASPFDSPWLSRVSSGYGWRVHPISGEKNLHRGVDIAAARGTVIKAVQDGRVISAGDMGSYGLCVVIKNDQGYQSRYAHCSRLNVSAGQEVKRGDVIGEVGSTGDSTGPHLHLEVMLDGKYLNPCYFVDTGGSGGR